MNSIQLSLIEGDENKELLTWLRHGLRDFNQEFMGPHQASHLSAVAKVGDEIVGGIAGVLVLDWLSVELAFLNEAYRGQGLGASLLVALEDEARKRGATRAFVDTTTFQAEGFYAKFGYVEWGRFRDFAPGVDRIYMRKDQL